MVICIVIKFGEKIWKLRTNPKGNLEELVKFCNVGCVLCIQHYKTLCNAYALIIEIPYPHWTYICLKSCFYHHLHGGFQCCFVHKTNPPSLMILSRSNLFVALIIAFNISWMWPFQKTSGIDYNWVLISFNDNQCYIF